MKSHGFFVTAAPLLHDLPQAGLDPGVTGKGGPCFVPPGEGDPFMLAFSKLKTFLFSRGAAGHVDISPPRVLSISCRGRRRRSAHGMGKEWGLGERVWPTRPGSAAKVFLFVSLGMFQHKSVHSKLSPGPTIVLITPHSGWAFHPEENGKIQPKTSCFRTAGAPA